MTTSLPALQQQSPKVPGKNGRSGGSPVPDDTQVFGKLIKSNAGHKGQPLAAQKTDAEYDTKNLPVDMDVVKDDLLSVKEVSEAPPGVDEGQGEAASDPDAVDGTAALLPLLGVAEFRNPKGTLVQEPEPGKRSDSATGPAAKGLPPVPSEAKALSEGRPTRLASLVEQPDPEAPARPAETSFGRTLTANLNDLATQAPDRPVLEDGPRTTRMAAGNASDAQPATQRDRNTIVPEAVTSAREPRQTGDRRAETRPAPADPKPFVAPSMPMPLSTGTPIVQALAAKQVSTVAATAAEIASQAAATAPRALKIQLHPAELGMVTANLRMTDGQLSVEIEVETQEAYTKLSNENGAIARALRNHGIAVNDVVIQAPQVQSGASARDGAGGLADTAPDAGRSFSGSGEFGQSSGSRQNAGHDNGQNFDKAPVSQRPDGGGDTGRGVYI